MYNLLYKSLEIQFNLFQNRIWNVQIIGFEFLIIKTRVLNPIKYNYILLKRNNEDKMKIVTTPMCEEILKLAGLKEYQVSLNPDSTDADIAVVLSETNTGMKSIKLKLNTFKQIQDSVDVLRTNLGTGNIEEKSTIPLPSWDKTQNRNIKVKVYSNFLKDIVEDMGYTVVNGNEYPDYLVYPDYIRDEIKGELDSMGENYVEIASHKNSPINPVKRAELRYKLLEKKLCMKH